MPTRFPPAALRWLLAAAVVLSGCASLRTRRSDAGSDDASSYAGDATSDSGWSSGPPGTQVQHGFASYYGRRFIGRRTANGEHYDPNKLTAAHRTLPFGSWVEVRANSTGRHVVVRINDRGPYVSGRVIDLSRRAAEELGIVTQGSAPVELRLLGAIAKTSR